MCVEYLGKRDGMFTYLCIIFRNAIYGSSVFFTRDLLESTDVLDVLAIRFLMSSLVFLLLMTCKVIKVNFKGKSLKYIFLAGLFEPVLYFWFETVGYDNTSAIVGAVIASTGPIVTVFTQYFVLKEKNTWLQNIFVLFGVAGALYIVLNTKTGDGNNSVLGMLFVFLAVAVGTLYTAFSRKTSGTKEFSAMEITCFTAFMGAIAFNGVNIVRHLYRGDIETYFTPLADGGNLVGFFFLAVVSTIVATLAGNYALSKIPPSRAGAFGGVSTITTIALGVLIEGEKLYPFHIVGTALTIICIFGVNYFRKKD